MRNMWVKLQEKLMEALKAVLPIMGIVIILCFSIAPISPSILLCFLLGSVLLILGMMFFTQGAEMAMSPMGERVGTCITKTRKVGIIMTVALILGVIITVSEPDLQVLAQQVPSVPNAVLILAVAAGVGVFLMLALLRMLVQIPLNHMLIGFYVIVFGLAFLVPKDFLSVAFDSGGVTTGPMTVPFIMALGVGVSAVRNDRNASGDSFGLVALCSVGPVLAVLILGMIYRPDESIYVPPAIPEIGDSVELWRLFQGGFPTYLREIAVSLLPIIAFFWPVSDHRAANPQAPVDQDHCGTGLYLHWAGTVSDRCQCGIYACR